MGFKSVLIVLLAPCPCLYIVAKDVVSGLHWDDVEYYSQCQPSDLRIFSQV